MPTWTGSINNDGSPVIQISLRGPIPGTQVDFEAIVDTGFSGFLSVPLFQVFPAGLVLYGTTSVVFANGSVGYRLTALGKVVVEQQSAFGLITLEPSSEAVLAGMDLLRRFHKRLIVCPETNTVLLEDEPPQPAAAQPAAPTP